MKPLMHHSIHQRKINIASNSTFSIQRTFEDTFGRLEKIENTFAIVGDS